MEFIVGATFRSKWFEGIIKVLSINEREDTLEVEYPVVSEPAGENNWTDTKIDFWNLSYTRDRFITGDYFNYQKNNEE
jgi:hypothetical protein